jgi:argininosuccinate lyase
MSIWKGRFKGGIHPEALAYSTSLPVDRKLFEQDIDGSIAHARMLGRTKIIPSADAKRIVKALESIRREIRSGKFPVDGEGRFVAEDVHMAIEARLIRKIGSAGGRLHTARSRNDQVALDERLYISSAVVELVAGIRGLQTALLLQAERHASTLMPGYTHLQRAQPIVLGHHLLAYVEMLQRDAERFADARKRAAKSPLGAGALAGTSFPIDRDAVARELGLNGIVSNSIDAVSDRDSLIEVVSACSIAMMHLSRLAEEIVLWSSREWRFVEVDDAFATGSSIMPQKKNPDMAELTRGKTGRVYGDLMALLTIMKGLPLAYNRDMQEDKEPLFDAVSTTRSALRIMELMVESLTFDACRFEAELLGDYSTATDLADYLVAKGMPFRNAHAIVGAIVADCARAGESLSEGGLELLQRHSAIFTNDALALLRPRTSIERKRSKGSTNPKLVMVEVRRWKKLFL